MQCSGERPTCGACLKRQSDCQYVETEARQAKRKYEELRKRRSVHEELFGLMRTLPEQDAVELLRRVRGGDPGAILNHFRDGDLLLQMRLVPETRLKYELPYSRDMPAILVASGSSYLDTTIYESIIQRASHTEISATDPERAFPVVESSVHQTQYVKPYHAAVFVEPRLESASPSEWTTVSRDDVLLRQLLAAYFTHEYHLFPVFQKDYFLEDMAIGQKDKHKTHFCLVLLVNAVLAYGCVSQPVLEEITDGLILPYSTATGKSRTASGIGIPKHSATDSSRRLRGFGKRTRSVANTADLRPSRPHLSSTLCTTSTASTSSGPFMVCRVSPLLETCACSTEMHMWHPNRYATLGISPRGVSSTSTGKYHVPSFITGD